MREIIGDLWKFHGSWGKVWQAYGDRWGVITTNGTVNKTTRECTMGTGTAGAAKSRYPKLPKQLGKRISEEGNQVFLWPEYMLITFPTKHNWWDKSSDRGLILSGIQQMVALLADDDRPIYAVRFGCGAGNLSWDELKPLIAPLLDDKYTIVDDGKGGGHRYRPRRDSGPVLPFSDVDVDRIETEAWRSDRGSAYFKPSLVLGLVATIRSLQSVPVVTGRRKQLRLKERPGVDQEKIGIAASSGN